jgi:hypothetical protein
MGPQPSVPFCHVCATFVAGLSHKLVSVGLGITKNVYALFVLSGASDAQWSMYELHSDVCPCPSKRETGCLLFMQAVTTGKKVWASSACFPAEIGTRFVRPLLAGNLAASVLLMAQGIFSLVWRSKYVSVPV